MMEMEKMMMISTKDGKLVEKRVTVDTQNEKRDAH